jgi:hypothetical protein
MAFLVDANRHLTICRLSYLQLPAVSSAVPLRTIQCLNTNGSLDQIGAAFKLKMFVVSSSSRQKDTEFMVCTSGHPWSNPIRVNYFSLGLSLIGIFLSGLPGTIVFSPGQPVFAPGNPQDGPFGRVD